MRALRTALVLTVPTLLVLALLLELVFRFVIPAAEFPVYTFDATDRLLKYSSTASQDGVFTVGAFAQQRGRWHINNAGWNNPTDYVSRTTQPRIAIIGDSYVEAFQVDIDQSLGPQLEARLQNTLNAEVYTFAISGASLAQYLHMTRAVLETYDPDMVVLNVVHNDFAEALCAVKQAPGLLCLEELAREMTERRIVPYEPRRIARLLRASSLIRYLVVNLKAFTLLERWRSAKEKQNANILVDRVRPAQGSIERATRYVLTSLRTALERRPLVVMMDAPRHDLYRGTLATSSVRWLNDLMRKETAQLEILFVDLVPWFRQAYERDQRSFDSLNDGHWNAHAHAIAAEALAENLLQIAGQRS